MSTIQPIPLHPIVITPGSPTFDAILQWPFNAQPFFEGQVLRLLQNDIPQRVRYGWCQVWAYLDPTGDTVGFSTLDLCREYEQYTSGKVHSYIPLLAVNPGFQRKGHGRTIVQHLIAEAVLLTQNAPHISEYLFLDVYTANAAAITLYEKCGFVSLNPNTPIPDPQENNEPYIIMSMRAAVP